MICPSCSAVVPDGSSFCENCGVPLAAANVANAASQVPPYPDSAAYPAQGPGAQGMGAALPARTVERRQSQPGQAEAQQAQYWQGSVQPDYQQQYGQSGQQPGQQSGYQPSYQQGAYVQAGSKNKLAAGLLAIFLGSLGIHKFYLGYTKAGVIMLVVTLVGSLFTLGLAGLVMGIIAIIEGVIYLTKSDYDFYQTYEVGEKQWF